MNDTSESERVALEGIVEGLEAENKRLRDRIAELERPVVSDRDPDAEFLRQRGIGPIADRHKD